jgi:hypothetical protein
MKWMKYMNGLMINQMVLSKYNIAYVPDRLIIRDKDYSGYIIKEYLTSNSFGIGHGIYIQLANNKQIGLQIHRPSRISFNFIKTTDYINSDIIECCNYVQESNYIQKCKTFL